MDLHLEGRTALVTGASRGIGAAVADVLAEAGCDIRLVAREGSALTAAAERVRTTYGVSATAHPVDLRNPSAIADLVATAGDVDILVNNAGDIPGGTLADLDDASWRSAFELKVFGYISVTRRVYARMKELGGGVVVNNIGASAERYDPAYIAGSTGNAALVAFTRTLGGASLADGIRVVGVSPAPVDTERIVTLTRSMARSHLGDAERYRELLARFPLGRPASTREIADAIAFLASDRSAYTSGVILTVDGGLTAAARV
ncbi:short-chain dehydrogenase/reductase [Solicola gregarius]|uniref:Short-chain dehydrogenase/reductase n=1 Tax=Solicola gregarius TaxID=2908642 RepID=A0AA46TIQ9_9ACTN|nr:short-chain dehydrogenase/reductase [Solicola gregarius]UYM05946.1 short-chain dehydrogenase/reductase [Solicola gregarius]